MKRLLLPGAYTALLICLLLVNSRIALLAQDATPTAIASPLSRDDLIATGVAATLTARVEQTVLPMTETANAQASFTATFTSTPSHTPTSTLTPTTTATLTPSRTPTNTRTLTPSPTLSDEQIIGTLIAATETAVADSVIRLCSTSRYTASAPRGPLTSPEGPFTVYQFGGNRSYFALFEALDPAQRVDDPAQARAVLCVRAARQPIETCLYDKVYKGTPLGGSGTIIREQTILTIYLVDVPTGNLVTFGEYLAPPPPLCPARVEANELGSVLRSPLPNITFFRRLLPTLLGQITPTPTIG